jgi:hypothetical protein
MPRLLAGGVGFVPDGVGMVDPSQGLWHLRNADGDPTIFFYGVPGDYPFTGDWDCDGVDTPGLYRQSDGFAYLRNSNSFGVANVSYFFGLPGDIPIAGDFNGDGCDTLSIYRPGEGRVYISNTLGSNGGYFIADFNYYFGNPGDKPFVGDFDGDGIETIGLHRESTGLVYFRNSHTFGVADNQFYFGIPNDRLVAGDWGLVDGVDTPAVFRPSGKILYFRHTNTQGNADTEYTWGDTNWIPVAGNFGPLSSGVAVSLSNSPPAGVRYAVESLYLELPRAPELPAGLRTNLSGLSSGPKSLTLNGVYTGAAAFDGHVAVVTIGSDVILLASDNGTAWRVVGAHMGSYGRNRWFGDSPRFVAVIGTDLDGNPSEPLYAYADSVHIISQVAAPTGSPAVAAGAIVGIPRDTVVHVPYAHGGTVGYCTGACDQINHTTTDKGGGEPKGPATTVAAIELETGIDLEGYFHTSFGTLSGGPAGFQDLVDAYIAVYTAFAFLVPYDAAGGLVTEGQTTVDGLDALRFARERVTRPRGDVDRTLAHGLLIKAAIANVQPFNLHSTPGLLAILDDYVTTDLSIDQVLTFAATVFFLNTGGMPTLTALNLSNLKEAAYDLNPGSIPNVVLSGCASPDNFNGAFAFWFNTNNRNTINDLRDGILSSSVIPCVTFP